MQVAEGMGGKGTHVIDVFVAYKYEGADEEYVAPMGSVISANEMAAYVLGIAPQLKSISAPSAVTPAVMMGETSSSAHHKPMHVTKDSLSVVISTKSSSDSPPVATSNAELSMENIEPQGPLTATAPIPMDVSPEKQDQSQRPATMCAGTVPNIDIPTQLGLPGAESAVSLGEDKDLFPPPTSSTAAEAVGSQNARNHQMYQGKSDHSWHHGHDALDRPVHKDFHVLLKENECCNDQHFNNSDDHRCGNHNGTHPRSYTTSSHLTLPHRQECLAFLNANKRLQMAPPPTFSWPTLMNRLHDVNTFPAASPPTLMERIHDVATFPVASPPVPEPSLPQQLQPAQVQTLLVTAEVGLPLIAEYYQANELQIDGPAFMTGITIPVTPALRSGCLNTTFRSAIQVVYDKLLHLNGSPADSIQTLLRLGAPFHHPSTTLMK
ncbi:hypothetical protein EV424DRAFT_1535757 [Suillus variegatus]|nr:hypothetical protein EV424DRAFT_1535757 [Suillus variegatus]